MAYSNKVLDHYNNPRNVGSFDRADPTVRRTAVRRSVWSYAVRRAPGGLLANLEIGFEPNGLIHLVPHLSREPSTMEAAELEKILTQAVDDLYARPTPA